MLLVHEVHTDGRLVRITLFAGDCEERVLGESLLYGLQCLPGAELIVGRRAATPDGESEAGSERIGHLLIAGEVNSVEVFRACVEVMGLTRACDVLEAGVLAGVI